ncbi:hypothetical protein [Aureimonas psammosilenae]|uniref:hypothetical protein n=1 Tax=Aureimonas psammosilenae TaxID=2495496 RepID=UPI0012609B84|nr:hypothetical protein [Aureimonas psammosilenae]
MATFKDRLARLEGRMGISEGVPRVIFVTGGGTTDEEFNTFLAAQGVHLIPRDLVFRTVYEAQPGTAEPSTPMRITSVTKLDGRLQAG